MAPTPQENRQTLHNNEKLADVLDCNRVVVSGISGLFPKSYNVTEFSSILYNKINPVTENSRCDWKHPEASQYIGMVPDIERFDSQFFMVHPRLANAMDPMARKALEHSYQAIYDAGLSPKHLSGKKVGVYIASTLSETERSGSTDIKERKGFAITGCSKTMYANRISYWLNAKGPSMSIDDACCGSLVALEEAFSAIKSGTCEAAIVGGANLSKLPHTMVHFNRIIKMSSDDKTKSFDKTASGCTKSEAISVLFLQKASDAKRAYAEIVHVKNEFISRISGETGQVFGFVRNPDSTAAFLKQFYLEANVKPQSVEFVEAFGSATPEADKSELQAIEKVFCENRPDPLLVGSVISNIGFTDAASGGVAMTKMILAYHNGLIASNLHCSTPRQDISSIRTGCMRIVTDHQAFQGNYAAVNCLSLTGINSHVLLRGLSKPKDLTRYKSSMPRLVTLSARQEEHLEHIFSNLTMRPIDPEELALLQNIHSTNISGHLGRGYIILDSDDQQQTTCLSKATTHWGEAQRPLWFVYSGMGSQWAGMGKQLMRIPVFADAIERCQKVLEPKGVDVIHIITSADKSIFDNVLNSFVGIAAIQIGLTDFLTAIGLHPDYIIGHSVGELGCAYADGCLTAEEMVLAAYSRGKASNETALIRGAMAAVGLGYQELSKLCPPEIDIACRNSSGSSTISGPEEKIREFVSTLTEKGIFAKEVASANIAYHSRYIANAGPRLLSLLSEIISSPRVRSSRWLSTSVPQERWNESAAEYCSAEYLTNNLLSPVYFEDTSRLIPSHAVVIEIAPHGLLQAILKRSLPETCTHIPLTKRGHKDNALYLLDAVGKLYVEGYSPQVQTIYPKVEFPVSTGTPHLAHFVKWNHSDTWNIPELDSSGVKSSSSCKFLVTTHDDEYNYLKGNVIQGKVLYPFASALVAVWDTLAMTLGVAKKEVSVRFHDLHLYSQPILHDQKLLRLNVSVNRGNGWFEVSNGASKIVTGYIYATSELRPVKKSLPKTKTARENFVVSSEEFYEHFSSRRFSYSGEFKSIYNVDESLTAAELVWKNKWETLIDGMLQLNVIKHLTQEELAVPSQIRELTIDIVTHCNSIQKTALGETVMKAELDEVLDYTRCGGVVIRNIQFRNLPYSKREMFKVMPSVQSDSEVNKTKTNNTWQHVEAAKKITLQIANVGNLDTLYWKEALVTLEKGVKVTVEYAGLNHSDVRRATGIIPFDKNEENYGMDFSGLTTSGERVMGVLRNGSASTEVSAWPELLWPVPAHWTLEEAATVPLAYVQAFYYLCVKNELQHGWRVLIHGATGALGQAAVSIALAHGCQVFATVSDVAKKQFLLRLFPQLKEEAVGNSRDSTFCDMVLNATNGEGCNIVISCIREDHKNCSLKCVSFSGVTIDTTQIQNRDKFEFGMFNMTKSRSFIAADVSSIFVSKNDAELRMLQTLVSEGIAHGYVRPLSRVTYASRDASRAFELLAASQHRGRVLLRMRDYPLHPQPRLVCSPDKSHIIVWDGSSFGLQLADKLISSGVTKLRIYCSNPKSHYQLKLRLWHKSNVDIKILLGKLTNSSTTSRILDEASQCGPIEGIYVTAVVSEQLSELPTILKHLDSISRTKYPELKYFAVIAVDSDVGQYLNTIQSRTRDGFPATIICLSKMDNSKLGTLTDESSWNQSASDATAQALRSHESILRAQSQVMKEPPLPKPLALLCDNEDEDISLRDLGIGESFPFIKSYLTNVCHLSLDDENILALNKKKLLECGIFKKDQTFKETSGLGTFFSFVDHDELRATTEMIPMNTLVCDVTSMENGIDDSKTHLFIIPGLEGHYARFEALCERLKLSALVLQPGLDRPSMTPREVAAKYSKILLESFKLKTKFNLLGYECGVLVALELASILENHGLTGTVYCIGEGPEEMKATLNEELRAFPSNEALRAGVAQHMQALMTHKVVHSAQYAQALVEAACARIQTVRCYSAAPRALRSRVVLLRVQCAMSTQKECSLQHYSQQPLTVTSLTAPLANAAKDLRVPTLINRYLDEEVLQIYDNSNLCDVYLTKSQ